MNGSINGTNSTSLLTSKRHTGYTYIILALLCVLSIFLNSLLTYCLVTNRKQTWAKKAKQLFYLVLSDLLVSIFSIPQTIFTQLPISRKTYEMCAILNFTVVSTQIISYCHVLSLCIHRFIMIRKVHLPFNVDKFRYGTEGFIIWVTVIVACVPPYVIWGRHGEVLIDCRFGYLFKPSDRPAIVYILVLLCIPWILTNIIYVTMVLRMMSTGRVQPASGIHSESHKLGHQDTVNQPVAHTSATQKQSSNLSHQDTANQPSALASATVEVCYNSSYKDTAKQSFAPAQPAYNLSHQDTAKQPVALDEAPQEQPYSLSHQNTANQPVAPAQQPYKLSQHDTTNKPVAPVAAPQGQPYSHIYRGTANQSVAPAPAPQEQPYSHIYQDTATQTVGLANVSQEHPNSIIYQVKANQSVVLSTVMQKQPSGPQAIFTRLRNRRMMKAIAFLLVAFNISILPLILIPSMMLHGDDDSLPVEFQGLVFLNNIFNPLIYTLAFTRLRDEVKRVLRRGLSRLRNILLCKNDN